MEHKGGNSIRLLLHPPFIHMAEPPLDEHRREIAHLKGEIPSEEKQGVKGYPDQVSKKRRAFFEVPFWHFEAGFHVDHEPQLVRGDIGAGTPQDWDALNRRSPDAFRELRYVKSDFPFNSSWPALHIPLGVFQRDWLPASEDRGCLSFL